jgi:hypothetical protein
LSGGNKLFKSFAAYETTSIECGGGDDIQRRTGDLREVDNKQFQMREAPKAYFPDDRRCSMAMTIDDDDDDDDKTIPFPDTR